MGRVVISPNIKKTAVRIDINGNEINPKTGKITKKLENEYIPPPPHVLEAWRKEKNPDKEGESSGGLEKIVADKLGEKISGAIEKAVEKIDLGDMIEKALDKALTKK